MLLLLPPGLLSLFLFPRPILLLTLLLLLPPGLLSLLLLRRIVLLLTLLLLLPPGLLLPFFRLSPLLLFRGFGRLFLFLFLPLLLLLLPPLPDADQFG